MFHAVNDSGKPLAERVSDEIVSLIEDGTFSAGDKLPNEFELCERLGVGRGTVREAIKALVSKNILEIRRGAGTFVCQQTGKIEDPLGLRFYRDKRKLGLDLCQVRSIIEPQIAAIAAANATVADMDELCALRDEVERNIQAGRDYGVQDIRLHTRIAQSTGNEVMSSLVPVITAAIPLMIDITDRTLLEETIATHRAIVDAICSRNQQGAEQAMREHIRLNREEIERR